MTDSNLTKVSLREFLEARFDSLERAFREHCSEARDRDHRIEALEHAVQSIQDELEHALRVVKWSGGILVTFLLALLIAYVKELLGL